jgi:NADH-quinone oxidoreductase subunit M
MDGLSWALCALTAFLSCIALISSLGRERSAGYWAAFLFLESACLGVFLVRDLFFFYIFWEAVLVPMFFIIGLWGSENRKRAAIKFFLFTFFGSIFLLLGILVLVVWRERATGVWSWAIEGLSGRSSGWAGLCVFLALVIGFGVKIPLFPLHTWLPDAHTEAPAAGSIMLAGVMLKLGVYGLVRVAIPVFPELSWRLLPWLGIIAAINVVYGALCAMAQSDLKRLVAYSSVAHLGFCVLGIISRTPEGVAGGSLQLINHGLTTGALFLLVGCLYERTHKRGLADFGELVDQAPWMTFFFGFCIFASIGLPGTNGFVGEFMSLAGIARALPALAILGAVGVVLAAGYAVPAFQTVFWGQRGPGSVSASVTDLDRREQALLWTLCLLMLAIGLYPRPLLAMIESGTGKLLL